MRRPKKGPNKRPPKAGTVTIQNKANNKFIKVLSTDSTERFDEIGELVKQKLLKWSHFFDNTHYYLILKKKKR